MITYSNNTFICFLLFNFKLLSNIGHMRNDMRTEIVAKFANSHPESEYVLEQEANILSAVKHENIVKVIGTVKFLIDVM